jgi:DNA-binding NarL/FixJ family response regulator
MPLDSPFLIDIAHENAVIEAGLRHILGQCGELSVLPPREVNERTDASLVGVNVLVLDHHSGVRWVEGHNREAVLGPRVVIVAFASQESEIRDAIQAGITGYLLVDCAPDEIVRAVKSVAQGRRYLCSSVTLRMADSLMLPTLTSREIEVLALVAVGRQNKEIARLLAIALSTVKSHMRTVMSKLGASCRTEALSIATRRGLLPPQVYVGVAQGWSSEQSLSSLRIDPFPTGEQWTPRGEERPN